SSEKDLNIFNKAIIEPLYFDKRNKVEVKLDDKYEIVDFDFDNDMHLINASEIINEDLGDFFKSDNIRKMATFPSFSQGLCFFIKDTTNEELIGVSISTYCKEVEEVDIDWMYIRKNYHRQGIGSFMINETVRRSKDAKIIRVSGKNEFYKRCGFIAKELWVWAAKPGYSFYAPAIQPNILE
ncbi:MAG: GNAT family N-acetyltransferase, partial [Clostridia bacterium]